MSAAIQAARAALLENIVVEVGVHPEAATLSIGAASKGLFIDGGWQREGIVWQRACESTFRAKTLLQVAASVGLVVEAVTVPSGLRNLTLVTKAEGASPANAAGESVFGIIVRGDDSVFNLHNVAVFAGKGGDGGSPPPVAAAGNASCNGVAGCQNTKFAAGAVGTEGTSGQDAALEGVFSATGFAPVDGVPGASAGGPGGLGGIGEAGACPAGAFTGCMDCATTTATLCADTGRCGCGGLGGAPGTAGRGGGASVALLVAGEGTRVSLAYSQLEADDGGSGSAGGDGGLGGPGTNGVKGNDRTVVTGAVCAGQPFCMVCPPCEARDDWGGDDGTQKALTGGAADGKGGKGGAGGRGGGGAGAPSYAIVQLGAARAVADDKTVLRFGAGGPGGNEAVEGSSGEVLTQQ